MARSVWLRVVAALGAAWFALGVLGGCASDPRFREGIAWVSYNEAEKARLDSQGFPQYNFY
jgi:hypothetical protein